MTLICAMSKSPHTGGRVGKKEWQDWYQCLVKATEISQSATDPKFLVVTGFQAEGSSHEVEIYSAILNALAPHVQIIAIRDGRETIKQIDIIRRVADEQKEELVIISTFLHYLRVRYLARGIKARHVVAFGIPRPREIVNDITLTALMPLVDVLGLRSLFLRCIEGRRAAGKF